MQNIRRTAHPCPACGTRDTISVTMSIGGSPTFFTSCPACEWKAWEREGEHLTLGSVLGIVSAR